MISKTKKMFFAIITVMFLILGILGVTVCTPKLQARAASGATQAADSVSKTSAQKITGETLSKRENKDIVGVTTSGGFYEFDSTVSCMEDGANRVKEMGSDVLKLWLSEQFNESYPFNTNWESYDFKNCVDLLKSEPYRKTLEKDFSTIIFEVYSFDYNSGVVVDWQDGMSDKEQKQLEDEMYQIAKHLMLTYNGSGKQFVLQNWEGDNLFDVRRWRLDEVSGFYYETAVGKSSASQATTDIVNTRIRGLTDWFNYRQKGVDRAMAEMADISDVMVRHALEINFTALPGDGEWPYSDSPYLLKTIVPNTDCDLYSYSCWSSQNLTTAYSLDARLTKYNSVVGATYKDIYDGGKVKSRRPLAREGQTTKVMLGEYGAPEKFQSTEGGTLGTALSFESDRRMRQVVQIQTEIALRHDLEYIVFWEMYCNVLMPGVTVNTMIGEQAEDNSMLQGNWLIRADGSYTDTYQYYRGILDPSSLLVNRAYAPNEVYALSGASGGIEVAAQMVTASKPVNVGNRGYDNAVKLEGSADGVSYTAISLVGCVDNIIEEGGKFTSSVKFVNAVEFKGDYRYFKVSFNRAQNELDINTVKFYPLKKTRLLKLKVSGKVGEGAVETSARYVIGSDERLKLTPNVTDEDYSGSYSFATSNRYIASVAPNGEVLGRTSGTAKITVKTVGGGLERQLSQVIEVVVKVDGEIIIADSFTSIETVGYRNNETKDPSEKLPGFGTHKFLPAKGEVPAGEQKFLETDNIQFFALNSSLTSIISACNGDPFNAYILDWENPSGHMIYESEEDIGGYQLGLLSYGQNGLDRVEVFVSADNKDYKKVNSFVSSSTDATLGYFKLIISNRQVIPSGMKYIKFKITYTSANKWNPQVFGINVLGAPAINPKYIDTVDPVVNVTGSYPSSAKLGDVITLLPATYSDDFATVEEMNISTRVFLNLEGTDMEIEVKDNKFTLSAVGDYRVVYTCEDLAGNPGKKEFTISVKEDSEEKGCGCGTVAFSDIPPVIGLFAIALTAGAMLLSVLRKKKVKA